MEIQSHFCGYGKNEQKKRLKGLAEGKFECKYMDVRKVIK